MDKAYGSTRLFSLRRNQDEVHYTEVTGQRAPSPASALALNHELHAAVRRGDVQNLGQLLRSGANPNAVSEDLRATPLHTAAMLGRRLWSDDPVYQADVAVGLLSELLTHGADVNALDKFGYSALHLAAATEDVAMVSLLLRWGANPSVQDFELLFTPLHVAISSGKMDAALLLIEAGVDTARTDYTGRSAWQVFAPRPTPTAAAAVAPERDADSAGGGDDDGSGVAVPHQPDGPTSMLQLLLSGLREGRDIPVSAVFNLVLEVTGSAAKAPPAAAGPAAGGDNDSAGRTVGALVRQLVSTIRDRGDLAGCWQLLAEAVRCGAGEVAALVVAAVVALHPASLAEIPWGGVLVDVLACMPEVFDMMVAQLKVAAAEHLQAAVRRLHPSRLEPRTRLLLYRRLVGALERSLVGEAASSSGNVKDEGSDGQCGVDGDQRAVALTFLQELPPDTVADLAGTPFFQPFTELLPASIAVRKDSARAAGFSGSGTAPNFTTAAAGEATSQPGGDSGAANGGIGSAAMAGPAVPKEAAEHSNPSLVPADSTASRLETFAAANLLQGAMQSGSLLAVDHVVQSVLRWQHAANGSGRRALLLGLHSRLLQDLATSFPTSGRALMHMPRQRGPLIHVALPRASGGRDGHQIVRCAATASPHLVWWPRLARALTAGPLAVGSLSQVEALVAEGLPLETLHTLVAATGGVVDGAAGDRSFSSARDGSGLEGHYLKPGTSRRVKSSSVVPVGPTADSHCEAEVEAKAAVADKGAASGQAGEVCDLNVAPGGRSAATPFSLKAESSTRERDCDGGGPNGGVVGGGGGSGKAGSGHDAHGGGAGSGGSCSELAHMRELMCRGMTAPHINCLVCSGTSLAAVVAALDGGVPLNLIAGMLDAGLCFQVLEALLHRPVHQSTRYWKLRPHNELFFRLPFATWHSRIEYAFFPPFLVEWAAAGWQRGFIDRIFHANDPLATRLKTAFDHRGVPQQLPPSMMAAHDPLISATARRRILLLRVYLAAWWLPQRWATASLLTVGWAAELATRWLMVALGESAGLQAADSGVEVVTLAGSGREQRQRQRRQLGLGSWQEELVPHDAVVEMLPVYGATRVGRVGLLQGLVHARVPSAWYGLELPRALVRVHWEGYARALFAMQGLEHILMMGLYGVFLWAARVELNAADKSTDVITGGSADTADNGTISSTSKSSWPLRTARLGAPLLLLAWAAASGLVLEALRARANGLAAYRSHQSNWLRVADSCLTLTVLAVLLAGGSADAGDAEGGDGGSGDGGGGGGEWHQALRVALSLGSVQVLLLCYQLLLFSSLSDGMGGLVRMVVEVVKSMGAFFLMLAVVFGGFAASFVVLMTTSMDLTAFAMRLFTVMLGDFANDDLHSMLVDGTFLAPALGVVLMAVYGVILIIVLVNLLIAIMTDAYAKVRSSEGAEVARNQAYIINDLQLGVPHRLAERIDTTLLGPYLHLLTVTAADRGLGGGPAGAAAAAAAGTWAAVPGTRAGAGPR